MAHMFTLSDNESETSQDNEDPGQTEAKRPSPHRKQRNTAPQQKGEKLLRQRNRSMNEEDLLESGTGEDESLVGEDLFRRRSRSAPPALWAAKKYGRQLRRMSDEFDVLLGDKELRKVRSAGTAGQMRQSRSWFAFLWSHKESEAESRPAG